MDTGAARMARDSWDLARRNLGDELLASLLGVSLSSVRRYATGARTPQGLVTARAHYLADVIHDLSGTYNEYGIKRWFRRPRTKLNGNSPLERLQGDHAWTPDSEAARGVARLARASGDMQAT